MTKVIVPIIFLLASYFINPVTGFENWELKPLGHYEIISDEPNLGGLSAIHITNYGKTFLVLSDRGKYFSGKISRNASGQIKDLNIFKTGPLLNSFGEILSGRNTDSESIAADHKGFYISFESNNRIMHHKNINTSGIFLPNHSDFRKLNQNKGLEAIAMHPNGTLYAVPEKPPEGDSDYPLYRLKNAKWEILTRFDPSNSFLVSDAVFLPDGNLLLLERDYSWFTGFKTQLRLLRLKNNYISEEKILLKLDSGLHNYEGISIWQDTSQTYFITLISDNNFIPFVMSEIIEYKLTKID